MLDNECSTEFKQAIKKNGLECELVPKGQHRRNLAERALKTWKSHTIGALSRVADTPPLGQWDELLPQLNMQVNLLRFSNVNPMVCSFNVFNGAHDFNRHLLSPLGVDIHMLENSEKRKTLGVRSKPGYYVGTSLEHYHYYWGWMRDTKKIRGSDTVSFKHKYITNPFITTGYAIVNAAQQLTSILSGSIPPPLVKSGIYHLRALTDIFNVTKEGYDEQENIKSNKTTAHSPTVPMGIPPPRVVRDKNPRDLIHIDTSDSVDEGYKNESNRLVIACPQPVAVPLKDQATPLPPIPDY